MTMILTLGPTKFIINQGKDSVMPSLEEVYAMAIENGGEDSRFAKAIKLQIECENYNKGRSLQALFEDEIGPKLQEINET